MIKDSPDLINAKEQASGSTPLHSAAALGQLVVAEFLLANGANVQTACERLLSEASTAGGRDNISAILIRHETT